MSVKLLFCTHISRELEYSLCSLNYLTRRYASPDRLKNLPDFNLLPDEQHAKDYIGGFTIWEWEKPEAIPVLREFVSKKYKVQDVCVHGNNLLVCGTNYIEVYPLNGPYDEPVRIISHPWFAGGHTIEINNGGEIVASCSGPDAILFFNLDGRFLRHYRIPESIYGENYKITFENDLRVHYINNDLQLGHLNSATPIDDGYLCSLLIPGAIGHFNNEGRYHEITRGFVGCHGIRQADSDTIYFSDSCNGMLVEMDYEGRIKRRFKANSLWLHDTLHIHKSLYLFSLSDLNALQLWDIEKENMIWEIKCNDYGATTQFLYSINT